MARTEKTHEGQGAKPGRGISRKRVVGIAVFVAVAAAALWWWESGPRLVYGDGKVEVVVEETVICRKAPGILEDSIVFSNDHKRCAYVVERGLQRAVVLDGVEGPLYDYVAFGPREVHQADAEGHGTLNTLTFSPDGKRFAYVAGRGDKRFVALDGVEGKEYDGIEREPFFSADGSRIAYTVLRDRRRHVIADGVEGPEYDSIAVDVDRGFFRSDDGGHYVYAARSGDRSFLVVDGTEWRSYDEVRVQTLAASADFSRIAYAARSGDKWLVGDNNYEGKRYDRTGWNIFVSRDGKHVGYVAREGADAFFVTDGVEGARYERVYVHVWSEEGVPRVYTARRDGRSFLVTDGVEGPSSRGGIMQVFFSADGGQAAYTVGFGGKATFKAKGFESKAYDEIEWAELSGDGARAAFEATSADGRRVVVDGVEGKLYEMAGVPFFSRDGRHVVYEAGRSTYNVVANAINRLAGRELINVAVADKGFVVVDGVESAHYEELGGLTITADDRHLVWIARADEKWFVVVDGVRKAECPSPRDMPFPDRHDGVIEYVGEDDEGFSFVTVKVEGRGK